MRYFTVHLLTLMLLAVVGGAAADAEGSVPTMSPRKGQCGPAAVAQVIRCDTGAVWGKVAQCDNPCCSPGRTAIIKRLDACGGAAGDASCGGGTCFGQRAGGRDPGGSACASVAQRGRVCCGDTGQRMTTKRRRDCGGGQCDIRPDGNRPRAIRVLRVVDGGDCQLVVLKVDGAICVLQPVQGNGFGGLCGGAAGRTRACGDRCDAGSACGTLPVTDAGKVPRGLVTWGISVGSGDDE